MKTGTMRSPISFRPASDRHSREARGAASGIPISRRNRATFFQGTLGGSGFANTDLDFRLKQKGIIQVIVIGLLANTCIETTSRFAVELGYHVTLVKDATAAFTKEMMRAAHELNGPTFAHAIH